MISIISIFVLQISSMMLNTPVELDPADLIGCVGRSFNEQKAFAVSDFTDPVAKEDDYSLMIISKTIKYPKRFRLFGISTQELNIALDSANKILAVFIKLENRNLVKKMEKAIGDEYVAVGVTPEGVEAPPSTY